MCDRDVLFNLLTKARDTLFHEFLVSAHENDSLNLLYLALVYDALDDAIVKITINFDEDMNFIP